MPTNILHFTVRVSTPSYFSDEENQSIVDDKRDDIITAIHAAAQEAVSTIDGVQVEVEDA